MPKSKADKPATETAEIACSASVVPQFVGKIFEQYGDRVRELRVTTLKTDGIYELKFRVEVKK